MLCRPYPGTNVTPGVTAFCVAIFRMFEPVVHFIMLLYDVKMGSIINRLIANALIISIKNAPTIVTIIKAC